MYFRSLLLGALVLGCCALAQADPPPPPLGENLVGDCTFTDPLESTPWQAESGALADMLCPSGGCGNCAEQVNVLRFRGRDTDDILAVRQEIILPAASSFDLSFDLKYCDTRPTGTVSVSLGNFDLYTITIPTRPTSGVRNFVHIFDNSGESPVQPTGLAQLVIANPALDGADIMLDNVRIVPRYSGSQCTLDPALLGEWKRKVNGGAASEDTWHFSADGTFYLNAMRGYYDEENGECCIYGTVYQGVWCVDMAQTPPTIYLRVDNESIYESKSAKAEKVFEPDCGAPERAWYGRYQVDGGQLSLRVQECPNPTFDSPPVFLSSGLASDNGSPLIAPCETPDGEGTVEAENTEGEGEGTVDTCPATPTADPAVVGNWSQKCGFYDGALYFGTGQSWSFNADGTFTSTETQYGDEWITGTSRGTYTVNTSVSPAQMDLQYCESCFDDVFDEIEGCDVCCSGSDTQQLAIYTIEGDILRIATGSTRPEILSTVDDHRRDDPEYCPANGEGEEPVCSGGSAGDNALIGQWHDCLVPDVSPERNWNFRADGTFRYDYDWGGVEPNFGTRIGSYSVNTSVTPHQIDFHVCELCYTRDEGSTEAKGGENTLYCSNEDFRSYGLYSIEGGELKFNMGGSVRPASLAAAIDFAPGASSSECGAEGEGEGPVDGEAETGTEAENGTEAEVEEGEGAALTCESGGPVDPDLLGPQFTRFCPDQDGLGWAFSERGTFREDNWGTQEGPYLTWLGTYSVDLDVTPHRMRLHYCHACVADDEVNEVEAECPWESRLMGCYDACSDYVTDKHALYEVENGLLTLVVADTPPATLDGAVIYSRNNEDTCPGHIEGEGEGQTGPSLADIIEGFLAADINDDRALSRTEAEALSIPTALFDSIDANEDGFIHVGEAFWAAGDTAPRHTSDQDLDGVIDLGELLRAIQFYNAGGYSCAPFGESEDAYLPQPYAGGGVDPACPAHASDYNPADGRVSLSELLRIIQLFNADNYTVCRGTGEDGFCI